MSKNEDTYLFLCSSGHLNKKYRSSIETERRGAGHDYSGDYDSGYYVTVAKCSICQETTIWRGGFAEVMNNGAIRRIPWVPDDVREMKAD